jgi:O-methyltransferase|tara:strand:+ start:966 stop:1742 length:777 start_codon:yes stop_codon:yes gene_type:complete
MNRIAKTINSITKKFGYRILEIEQHHWTEEFIGITKFEKSVLDVCANYSMTSYESMYFLIKAIMHIKNNEIKGDFIECGVWKGGNLILFQKMIQKLKIKKKIYGYDTFGGMTKPGKFDYTFKKESAQKIINLLKEKNEDPKKNIVLAECSLEEVKKNYNKNTMFNRNLICIKGPVEKTLKIKKNIPAKISILRLDTDWYESTKQELEILFPRLSKNGILIIDDYGYWNGAKKAVDMYFRKKAVSIFKIDFTSRFVIKK